MSPHRARHEYDAVVIGAGPNGLVAAVELATTGHRVLVLEAADRPGGGARTEELTLDGFRHDVCSAIHPMALASAALRDLPLDEHGVRWIHPDVPLAHPLDGGRSAILDRSVDVTAASLAEEASGDGRAWRAIVGHVADAGLGLLDDLLDPLSVPRHPVALARFGLTSVQGATRVGNRRFDGEAARALLAGLAGHGIQPLDAPATTGYAVLLGALGHLVGWPMPEGGSQRLADALVSIVEANGGEVRCGHRVGAIHDVPPSTVVLADVTPRQLVEIAGDDLPARYRRRLGRYRHGPGVFKVDWALDGPVPWADPEVDRAGTVHVGGTMDEIAAAEAEVAAGGHPDRPFVLVAQQSRFDATRAPEGRHTLWGYCHVPNGSTVDMTDRI
ncbi:MAG: NAD(P)/FAD-dependent oxidoreductase, partial [Ilumatobacteraceae bacterium]